MNPETFEQHRPHLRSVAHRMLGSASEAEDAVQEAWLRASAADSSDVDNIAGWLTTITARVCLNLLRTRSRRPVERIDDPVVVLDGRANRGHRGLHGRGTTGPRALSGP